MKKNYKNEINSLVKKINKGFSKIPFTTHFALATRDYDNIELITDKELCYLLNKYYAEKELDLQIPHSEQFEDIFYTDTYEEEDENY